MQKIGHERSGQVRSGPDGSRKGTTVKAVCLPDLSVGVQTVQTVQCRPREAMPTEGGGDLPRTFSGRKGGRWAERGQTLPAVPSLPPLEKISLRPCRYLSLGLHLALFA